MLPETTTNRMRVSHIEGNSHKGANSGGNGRNPYRSIKKEDFYLLTGKNGILWKIRGPKKVCRDKNIPSVIYFPKNQS